MQAKLDHIFLSVEHFEETLAFYTTVLGWNIVNQWGEGTQKQGCMLHNDGQTIVLAQKHEAKDASWSEQVTQKGPVMHFEVDDLQAHRDSLPDTIKILVEPEETHWGVRWMVLSAPDGNVIALFEKLAA